MDLESITTDVTNRDWQHVEETDDPVRFAMIGIGWWTREQAIPAVQSSSLAETTTLVTSDTTKADSVAQGVDSIKHTITYEEFHQGARSDAYDAVYIVTPNAKHLPFVETAAELNKAVLCEKPMEATIERAEEMVSICEQSQTTLMITYRMHTEPAIRRAKELIDAGYIGEPVFVHGNMTQPIMELIPDPDQWRLDWELSGGSAAMDIGIYSINTARYLLGSDPVRVSAMAAAESQPFDDVPDEHISFQLEFENGVFGLCSASQNAHVASHIRVTGTDGQVRVEPAFFPWDDRRLHIDHGEGTIEVEFEQIDQMEEEFEYFAHCLLTGTEPYADGEHGLTDIRIIKTAYESADIGEQQRLET